GMFDLPTMMNIPGIFRYARLPALPSAAPKTSFQALVMASGSGTMKWMCPSATPWSFGGAGWAKRPKADVAIKAVTERIRIGLKLSQVTAVLRASEALDKYAKADYI